VFVDVKLLCFANIQRGIGCELRASSVMWNNECISAPVLEWGVQSLWDASGDVENSMIRMRNPLII
jgi:hypothetical protein